MNLKTYYEQRKENPFINIPMTFHMKEKGDKEFDNFLIEYNKREEEIKEEEKNKKNNPNNQIKYGFKPKRRNAWLVKPGENTNRGNGIVVVETLDEIHNIIDKDQ
jgi:tubulin polyglutamylase TTLL1/tubulin monoglycylase TTLL3/8